jgi:hypothetical protein
MPFHDPTCHIIGTVFAELEHKSVTFIHFMAAVFYAWKDRRAGFKHDKGRFRDEEGIVEGH